MPSLSFPDLTVGQARALLVAYDDIVNSPVAAVPSPEEVATWLVRHATEHQVAILRAIAAGAPDWVPAAALAERTGLASSRLGGVNARMHAKVTRQFGEAVGFPWVREERAGLVRYQMDESVAAAVLDASSRPQD
jgi:hypothetical protein